LLVIGVPYADALQMPVDLALAMLKVGRQHNTRQNSTAPSSNGKKMIATRRKSKEQQT
jgi:hypothetical protein